MWREWREGEGEGATETPSMKRESGAGGSGGRRKGKQEVHFIYLRTYLPLVGLRMSGGGGVFEGGECDGDVIGT